MARGYEKIEASLNKTPTFSLKNFSFYIFMLVMPFVFGNADGTVHSMIYGNARPHADLSRGRSIYF
jgi:hypothetical protein